MRIEIVDMNGSSMGIVELSDDEPFKEFFKRIRDASWGPFIVFVYKGDTVISDDDTPIGIRYSREPIVAKYTMRVRYAQGKEVGFF